MNQQDPSQQAHAYQTHARHQANALLRSRSMLTKMAGYFQGDALAQIENEIRKLDYLLQVQP